MKAFSAGLAVALLLLAAALFFAAYFCRATRFGRLIRQLFRLIALLALAALLLWGVGRNL